MGKLGVLCTTMRQNDFRLYERMNLHSDAVFANQCEKTCVEETNIDGNRVRMISTETRGVGKNRNISLLYAQNEILLFADDDMKYSDSYEADILSEFEKHPDADVFIFNIHSNNDERQQEQNKKTRKLNFLSRLPYGAPRIAIRKDAWERSNVWFTPLFGGGTKYTSGEDSIFLNDLRRAGLTMYVSSIDIGEANMDTSSWFTGKNEEYYFNKGAFCAAEHPRFLSVWKLYYCIRIKADLSLKNKLASFEKGVAGFKTGRSFADFAREKAENEKRKT